MFTGLVQATGNIQTRSLLGNGIECSIQAPSGFVSDIAIGDSINVNGVCSTAISKTDTTFTVQYLEETLAKTTMDSIKESDIVNLEPCLTLATKLGGHLVSGHIDDTGTIQSLTHDGEWAFIKINYNSYFAPYLIPKGSIAIDGISLTVVDVAEDWFSCHLIPHTIANTSLQAKSDGDLVNLEFDQVGKYLYRFHTLFSSK